MSLKNLKKRAPVTLIGIPALVGLTLYTQTVFLVFVTVAGLLVLSELYRLARPNGTQPNVWLGILIYLVLMADAVFMKSGYLLVTLMLGVLLLLIGELFRKKEHVLENVSVTFFGAAFIAFSMAAFASLQKLGWEGSGGHLGGYLVLMVFVSVWACDTMAYFVGSAIGKHKIFPRVSPNKSWEGSIAGVLGALIGSYLVHQAGVLGDLTRTDALVIALIGGIAGQIGDFAESLAKRDVGVKDSSNLLPGHGGAWDRLDSILFAAPLSYFYLIYFAGLA